MATIPSNSTAFRQTLNVSVARGLPGLQGTARPEGFPGPGPPRGGNLVELMRYPSCRPERFEILRSVGLTYLIYGIIEDGVDAVSLTIGVDKGVAFHSR